MKSVIAILVLFSLVASLSCYKLQRKHVKDGGASTGCQVDIKQLPVKIPLLVTPSTTTIIYPTNGSIITLSPKDQIEIDCPGSGSITVGSYTTDETATATCVSGLQFNVDGHLVDLDTIVCPSITNVAQYTGETCWETGKEIEVGFETQDGRFLQQYTACFDDELKTALYSRYELTKYIGGQVVGQSRPSWSEDDFYGLGSKLDKIYPKVAQRKTINKLLGLEEEDNLYVNSSNANMYLAKGHLTARTDFSYGAQQLTTFHYINSAPQWQSFNGLNWAYLEKNLRAYAASNFVDLEVYTGTYGVTTLPHAVTGEDVELYLYMDDKGNPAMPVPELFWKVAYDPLNKAGVAVLGINNPYQSDIEKSVICEDIADELNWWTFDRSMVDRGYMYACTVDEFRKVIPQLPQFNVKNILN